MFRNRTHNADGDDLGEATYAVVIKPGDEIHGENGNAYACSKWCRSTTTTRSLRGS